MSDILSITFDHTGRARSTADVAAAIMAEFKAAEARPRLRCADCQQPAVLDIEFARGAEPICDACTMRRQEFELRREQRAAFHRRRELAEIPHEFHNVRLQDYNPHATPRSGQPLPEHVRKQRCDLLAYLNRFAKPEQPAAGALILGPAGTGKTLLTAGLANRFCFNGFSLRWIDGYQLGAEIAAEWNIPHRDKAFKSRLSAEIASFDVVVWEDLQIPSDNPYPWYVAAVNDILNQISIRKPLLFVTTNHRRKRELILENGQPMRGQNPKLSLESAFGEKFVSRLDALCKRFPLSGPDMRSLPE